MTVREKLNIIKRSIRFAEAADKGIFRRAFVNIIPDVISTFSGVFLASLVIDGVTGGKPVSYLLKAAAIVCVIELISQLIRCINNRRLQTHDTLYKRNVEGSMWRKVLNMDYAKIEDIDTQNKLDNARNYGCYNTNTGLPALTGHLTGAAKGVLEMAVGFALAVPILFSHSVKITDLRSFMLSGWGVAAVLAVCGAQELLQSLVLIPKSDKIMNKVYTNPDILQAERERNFFQSHTIYEYRNGKKIRLYSEQKLIERKYKKAISLITNEWSSSFKGMTRLLIVMYFLDILANLILYAFAIFRAVNGVMTAGEVVAFVMYFTRIQWALEQVSQNVSSTLTKSQMWSQVFEFLYIPDEKYKGTIPTEKRDDNEYEFEFRHVYFKYPGSEQYVLQDINLKWRVGEKMALVGKNGSGKSTLVKLLCRLYDPTEGEITLNGIDIRKYKYEEYMDLFSVVFQDSKLFSFSIAENVAADTEYDAKRVEDCVRRAGFSERLDSMEKGIETCLYKDFDENGVEISGGEAQKLCLARAIYKGSPFIVLDEPTAALDPISEHDIYTKFNSIVGTRTAIYISHRLSSCRFCDDITVLDGGRIVERGSHDKLLNNAGAYSELWAAQAEYYKDTASELFA
ncbi:ABC transporter ATP-binding protein [Ruminococcus sp. Marseille-P6503]|uniref:ABC transporter ATP-binding protein n=1 Tax=Ruminococcus sp. Marseille-P6503 TaxID=2364796 RepID=UPI000F53D4F3|nr:ABC transporter ATP-binding protein [Ruminococcus sp. Marseille-P6503]